jgi:hypothetical protein
VLRLLVMGGRETEPGADHGHRRGSRQHAEHSQARDSVEGAAHNLSIAATGRWSEPSASALLKGPLRREQISWTRSSPADTGIMTGGHLRSRPPSPAGGDPAPSATA